MIDSEVKVLWEIRLNHQSLSEVVANVIMCCLQLVISDMEGELNLAVVPL